MARVQPVVRAGGSGTRLWPVSRAGRPKQFQTLIGDHSMFQDTVLRVTGAFERVEFASPVMVGATRFADLIDEQLEAIDISASRIILEPLPRNTGAIAAQPVSELGEAEQALLLPSDPFILDEAAFLSAVAEAFGFTGEGWITIFGITPRGAETGYGYIRKGAAMRNSGYRVTAIVEKPDPETAHQYACDPGFSWNAGIFQFPPETLLEEMHQHAGDIARGSLMALAQAASNSDRLTLDAAVFEDVRSQPVDFALMEHPSAPRCTGRSNAGGTISDPGARLPTVPTCKRSAVSSPRTVRTALFAATGPCSSPAPGCAT